MNQDWLWLHPNMTEHQFAKWFGATVVGVALPWISLEVYAANQQGSSDFGAIYDGIRDLFAIVTVTAPVGATIGYWIGGKATKRS